MNSGTHSTENFLVWYQVIGMVVSCIIIIILDVPYLKKTRQFDKYGTMSVPVFLDLLMPLSRQNF